MIWILGWFVGTMIVPLIIPIDRFFGFSPGSITVISWIAAAIREMSYPSLNLKKKDLGINSVQDDSHLRVLGEILLFTLGLALLIVAIKALF
jgi:hypothetical protein